MLRPVIHRHAVDRRHACGEHHRQPSLDFHGHSGRRSRARFTDHPHLEHRAGRVGASHQLRLGPEPDQQPHRPPRHPRQCSRRRPDPRSNAPSMVCRDAVRARHHRLENRRHLPIRRGRRRHLGFGGKIERADTRRRPHRRHQPVRRHWATTRIPTAATWSSTPRAAPSRAPAPCNSSSPTSTPTDWDWATCLSRAAVTIPWFPDRAEIQQRPAVRRPPRAAAQIRRFLREIRGQRHARHRHPARNR